MVVNVQQSSFSGVVLNVSRLEGIKEIIESKVIKLKLQLQCCTVRNVRAITNG